MVIKGMKKGFLLLLMLCLVLCGCGGEEPAPTTQAPTIIPTTEAVTEPVTEATTIPTDPPVVYHSGLRADGSFDEGTWFIGDSMTCILITDYLMPNNLIGDANYTAKYGSQITAFADVAMRTGSYNPCVFNPEFEGMTYKEVGDRIGEEVTSIYLMWGTNFTWNAYADAYIEIVDYLLVTCPNATIHLQLIPIGAEEFVKYDTVNGWINEAYAHYQELGEERVFLIDTFTAIGRNHDSGYIHLNDQGNENWYNAIVEHARTNGLVQ